MAGQFGADKALPPLQCQRLLARLFQLRLAHLWMDNGRTLRWEREADVRIVSAPEVFSLPLGAISSSRTPA